MGGLRKKLGAPAAGVKEKALGCDPSGLLAALGRNFLSIKSISYTSTSEGMATTWLAFGVGRSGSTYDCPDERDFVPLIIRAFERITNLPMLRKRKPFECEKLERLFFHLLLAGEIHYWIPNIFWIDKLESP